MSERVVDSANHRRRQMEQLRVGYDDEEESVPASQGCQMAKFAAKRSHTVVQKPEGPNTYNVKIWL